MVFTLLIVCLLLFWLCNHLDAKKRRRVFVVTITIVLVLVSGLRHESVGSDTAVYMSSYENSGSSIIFTDISSFWDLFINQSKDTDKDPGYTLFVQLLSPIVPSARAFLFIVAALSMGTLAFFIHKNILTLKGILFFYVYYISIFYGYIPNSAVRQALAISFIILGFGFLQKRQMLKFAVMVLLGSFIHMSALITLLLIPLSYININKIKTIGYLGFILFGLALINVNGFASIFLTGNERYSVYVLSNYYGVNGKPIVVIFLFIGLYLISFLGLLKDKNLKENNMFYYGSFLSLIFSSLIWVDPSLIRITAYFGPLMGVAIANYFNNNKNKNENFFLIGVILIFLLSALRNLNDYHFMWEHVAW